MTLGLAARQGNNILLETLMFIVHNFFLIASHRKLNC